MAEAAALESPVAAAGGARAARLDEAALVAAFAAGELSPEGFDHRQHVRLAWACLDRWSLAELLPRFRRGLETLARRAGKPGLYHETITWAYLLLVHERRARTGAAAGWSEFAAANPDLLDRSATLLGRYYRPETLDSALARRVFVFPDCVALSHGNR